MSYPIIALWSVPRSVSTSFERMVSERGDHTVFDEPFSRTYYFGPDRHSHRYDETIPHSAAHEIVAEIEEAAADRPVFLKDMAYHAQDVLPLVIERWRSCFLVRHPANAIRSLAAQWPDFTDDETGWRHLDLAADLIEDVGDPLVVVDAHRLCDEPERVVSRWCAQMGLEHDPDSLTWEPGMRPEWELWADWHASTARTSGFRPMKPPPPPPSHDDVRLRQAYDEAMPVYQRLFAHAI